MKSRSIIKYGKRPTTRLAALFFLTACGGGGGGDNNATTPKAWGAAQPIEANGRGDALDPRSAIPRRPLPRMFPGFTTLLG